jgi:hypothetical protein
MIALRKLIFGETRILPVGIVVLVAGAVVLGDVGGRWWHDAGGFALLAAAAALLAASVRSVG